MSANLSWFATGRIGRSIVLRLSAASRAARWADCRPTEREIGWMARCLVLMAEIPDRHRRIELVALIAKIALFETDHPSYRALRLAAGLEPEERKP